MNLNSQELLTAFVTKVEASGKPVNDLFNGSGKPSDFFELSELKQKHRELQDAYNCVNEGLIAEKEKRVADVAKLQAFGTLAQKYKVNSPELIEAAFAQYDPARKVKPKDPLTVFPFGLTIPKLISVNYPHLITSLEQSETREELQAEIDHLLNMLANNPPIKSDDDIVW